MRPVKLTRGMAFGLTFCLLLMNGCGGGKSDENQTEKSPSAHSASAKSTEQNGTVPPGGLSDHHGPSVRQPLTFGGPGPVGKTGNAEERARTSSPTSISNALKPLQVIVGQWNGKSRKKIAGAVSVEEPAWRWDFSKADQPALAFDSKTSPYLKSGRLTYLPEKKVYQLTATDKNAVSKVYEGDFSVGVSDVPTADGKSLDRTFTLSLTQVSPPPDNSERNFRVDLQQMENDRYLMIVHRKTGTRIFEWDRVANQRQGTSFAAKLDDYGDKTCVVSQGLGTIAVAHNGKTYYVCCSGCKKAFEAEPEKWIASYEEWKKANGKK